MRRNNDDPLVHLVTSVDGRRPVSLRHGLTIRGITRAKRDWVELELDAGVALGASQSLPIFVGVLSRSAMFPSG